MKNRALESIVFESLDYINENLDKPILPKEMAEKLFFSSRYIRKAFKEVTGISLQQTLINLRLSKAKELLRATNLPVSQIASKVGMDNHSNFTNMFKKNIGMSPKKFRLNPQSFVREANETEKPAEENPKGKVWLENSFNNIAFPKFWSILRGNWEIANNANSAIGSNIGEHVIALKRPLPENFRMAFEANFASDKDLNKTSLLIDLCDENLGAKHYQFAVGSLENRVGRITFSDKNSVFDPRLTIETDTWQSVYIELNDDNLKLGIKGKGEVLIKDAFPPDYAKRSMLTIGGWQNRITFKNVVIEDLGYRQSISVIKNADSLYNAGLYDGALKLYLRFLDLNNPANEMELKFKIGSCFLKQGEYARAINWFDQVLALGDDEFWRNSAQFNKLECLYQARNFDLLGHGFTKLLEGEGVHFTPFPLLHKFCEEERNRGFFDNAEYITEVVYKANSINRADYVSNASLYQNLLIHTGKYEKGIETINEIISSCKRANTSYMAIDEMYCLIMLGKTSVAENELEEFHNTYKEEYQIAQYKIYAGITHRARGAHPKALECFLGIPRDYPSMGNLCAFAMKYAVQIHICQRNFDEAERLMNTEFLAKPEHFTSDAVPANLLPALIHIGKEEYGKAGDTCSMAAEKIAGYHFVRSAYLLCAAILAELGGDNEKATKLHSLVEQLYPQKSVNFSEALSKSIKENREIDLGSIPAEAELKSTMCHLIGLLYEKRGTDSLAQKAYKLALSTDKSMRWAAYKAKEKLGRG